MKRRSARKWGNTNPLPKMCRKKKNVTLQEPTLRPLEFFVFEVSHILQYGVGPGLEELQTS